MSENNRPVHQVRIGKIKAAVFENGDNAPRKVQFTALYKEGDEWRGSASFAREDLPLLDQSSGPSPQLSVRAERFCWPVRFLEANMHHRPLIAIGRRLTYPSVIYFLVAQVGASGITKGKC